MQVLCNRARDFKIHYADGNEIIKKAIGFTSKTTPLLVHHAFCTFLCPFLHDDDVKMPNFTLYGGRKQATTKFSLSELGFGPKEFNSRRVRLHLTKLMGTHNCDKD